MIIRIFIAIFASTVAGLSYLAGLGRLMSSLLIGFGALSSFFLAVLFILPVDSKRAFFPVYAAAPWWPYVLIGLILLLMIPAIYLLPPRHGKDQQVALVHFKYLLAGIGGYLASLFVASAFWFPSDEKMSQISSSALQVELIIGTVLFLIGICVSCYFFYMASRGVSVRHPDLMRRFVLGFFTLCQFDKMPLLVTYLLMYSPESQVNFPHIAAFGLASYVPVCLFLLAATLEMKER